MTDKEKLDEAVQRLKQQMSADSKKADWKEAYLHGIDHRSQSLNRSVTCPN